MIAGDDGIADIMMVCAGQMLGGDGAQRPQGQQPSARASPVTGQQAAGSGNLQNRGRSLPLRGGQQAQGQAAQGLPSAEMLEEALRDYPPGTLLVLWQ